MSALSDQLGLQDRLRLQSAQPTAEIEEALPRYFRDIARIPLLTFEDEVQLASAIEEGRAASEALSSPTLSRLESIPRLRETAKRGEEARTRLVEANLRLVVSVARKYANRGLALDDLIQAGNLGLMRAVEKFDHRLGFRFSTYAMWWVRQSVSRLVNDQSRTIRIPAHLLEAAQRVNRHANQLQMMEGREPSLNELSEFSGITPERLGEINRAMPALVSLDLPVSDEQDAVVGDFVQDPDDPELDQLADREYLETEINGMLDALTQRERSVLEMRYGLEGEHECTLEEIGRTLGITRERARQLEAAALRKLRRPMCADRLRGFV